MSLLFTRREGEITGLSLPLEVDVTQELAASLKSDELVALYSHLKLSQISMVPVIGDAGEIPDIESISKVTREVGVVEEEVNSRGGTDLSMEKSSILSWFANRSR